MVLKVGSELAWLWRLWMFSRWKERGLLTRLVYVGELNGALSLRTTDRSVSFPVLCPELTPETKPVSWLSVNPEHLLASTILTVK